MKNIQFSTPIILASQSPRRKELLEQVGLVFEVEVSNFPEEDEESDPVKRSMNFALQKARAVGAKREEGIVIGADTVLSLIHI